MTHLSGSGCSNASRVLSARMKVRRGRDAAVSAAIYTAARGAMRRCVGRGGDPEGEACRLFAVRLPSGCLGAPPLLPSAAAVGYGHLGAAAVVPGTLHLLRCCWSPPETPAETAKALCFTATAASTACEEEEAMLALDPLNGTVDKDAQVAGSTAAEAEEEAGTRLDGRAEAEAAAPVVGPCLDGKAEAGGGGLARS